MYQLLKGEEPGGVFSWMRDELVRDENGTKVVSEMDIQRLDECFPPLKQTSHLNARFFRLI